MSRLDQEPSFKLCSGEVLVHRRPAASPSQLKVYQQPRPTSPNPDLHFCAANGSLSGPVRGACWGRLRAARGSRNQVTFLPGAQGVCGHAEVSHRPSPLMGVARLRNKQTNKKGKFWFCLDNNFFLVEVYPMQYLRYKLKCYWLSEIRVYLSVMHSLGTPRVIDQVSQLPAALWNPLSHGPLSSEATPSHMFFYWQQMSVLGCWGSFRRDAQLRWEASVARWHSHGWELLRP